jgi:hypothetical protein
MFRSFIAGAFVAALAFTARAESAPVQVPVSYFGPSSVLVGFDRAPDDSPIADNQPLGNLYGSVGVTFGPDVVATSSDGFATSLPNRAMGGQTSSRGLLPIDCYFSGGVLAVGAYGFDFVLDVFDESDNFIYRVSFTDGTAGIYGGDAELAFLGIASDVPIHHARFSRFWTNQTLFGYEIDDLRFTPLATTASVQSTWGRLKNLYR